MKVNGMKNLDEIMRGQFKLDTTNDIKDFLKGFNTIGEAKHAILAIIEEIRQVSPALAQKLEKLLQALDKAQKAGMTLDDFIKNLEKIMVNDSAAMQGMSMVQQAQNVFNDAGNNSTQKVNGTSAIV